MILQRGNSECHRTQVLQMFALQITHGQITPHLNHIVLAMKTTTSPVWQCLTPCVLQQSQHCPSLRPQLFLWCLLLLAGSVISTWSPASFQNLINSAVHLTAVIKLNLISMSRTWELGGLLPMLSASWAIKLKLQFISLMEIKGYLDHVWAWYYLKLLFKLSLIYWSKAEMQCIYVYKFKTNVQLDYFNKSDKSWMLKLNVSFVETKCYCLILSVGHIFSCQNFNLNWSILFIFLNCFFFFNVWFFLHFVREGYSVPPCQTKPPGHLRTNVLSALFWWKQTERRGTAGPRCWRGSTVPTPGSRNRCRRSSLWRGFSERIQDLTSAAPRSLAILLVVVRTFPVYKTDSRRDVNLVQFSLDILHLLVIHDVQKLQDWQNFVCDENEEFADE